ncbi:hypothetical protein DFH05DRAFT_1570663 [Lentinula detonsa]|uniref:MULE transposase domain-containing protein n=1 Tax=Lentinula detonsa TaxID=2804962 RepID=A0A9W8PCW3_9AGAR|nr:hypothetical protein DFH05DRAFT_1570663 [Lentinula detonsa]
MSSPLDLPLESRTCAKPWCTVTLPAGYKFLTCRKCLNQSRESKQRVKANGGPSNTSQKRKHDIQDDTSGSQDAPTIQIRQNNNGSDSKDDEINEEEFSTYSTANELFRTLRALSKQNKPLSFRGAFSWDDSSIAAKDKVQRMALQVWKVAGNRYTVKNHKVLKSGHYTRFWCSQDEERKRKPKITSAPSAKKRDTPGMNRFPCKSLLVISYSARHGGAPMLHLHLEHHMPHVPYYDVCMPEGAADIICQHADWLTPVQIAGKIRLEYPHVMPQQVSTAWAEISQIFWKRNDNQLTSLLMLLTELGNEVDVFDVGTLPDGIEMVCWGMKKINGALKGKVVEIALDATYNTNSRHLELYTIMFEYDNAGFPASYCLLTTATAVEPGKRTCALRLWMDAVKTKYNVHPRYVHLDKDMAEIGASKAVWEAKISLCWWHLRRAVRTRLSSAKLGTTPYDAQHQKDFEGGKPSLYTADDNQRISNIPDISTFAVPKLTVRLPPLPPKLPPALNASGILKIRIPPRLDPDLADLYDSKIEEILNSEDEDDESGNDPVGSKHHFCSPEFRQPIIDLMEQHYCAHPLIPGYAHPSLGGIKEWAVKKIYSFCVKNDLREVWAYIWENWYRAGRWELWARSVDNGIAILKTTMMVEAHWRRIKHDFLHHFHSPRIDLLAWILITKLAPPYYHHLSQMMTDSGCYRNLASWRKGFKAEWKKLEKRPITYPLSDKYRPDPSRWALLFKDAKRTEVSMAVASMDLDSGDILTNHCYTGEEDEEIVDIGMGAQGQQIFDETIDDKCTLLLDFVNAEGAGMLQMAKRCLDRERQYNSTRSQNPRTWDAGTSSVMFFKARPIISNQ